MELLARQPFDVVLLDIHMPGADGLTLAQTAAIDGEPPAIVFVTAYAEHAVAAFELEAVDYLTKPVRLERLQAALQKVGRQVQVRPCGHSRQAETLRDPRPRPHRAGAARGSVCISRPN